VQTTANDQNWRVLTYSLRLRLPAAKCEASPPHPKQRQENDPATASSQALHGIQVETNARQSEFPPADSFSASLWHDVCRHAARAEQHDAGVGTLLLARLHISRSNGFLRRGFVSCSGNRLFPAQPPLRQAK